MIPALALAVTLMLAQAGPTDAPLADAAPAPPAASQGEPLPPGAPTDSYELSAWCFGALDEYLSIYDRVKPDLRDIDHMFGTSVVEDEPYHADMNAARVELKMIADSVTQAEKASPTQISDRGLDAIKRGRAIWSVAEAKPHRDLARAWMLWALPDRCDSNAKELTQRSILFGKALNYNNGPSQAPSSAMPPPAADPNAQASPTTDTNVPANPAPDAGAPPAAPAPTSPPPAATDPGVPPYPTAPASDSAPASDQPTQAPAPQN